MSDNNKDKEMKDVQANNKDGKAPTEKKNAKKDPKAPQEEELVSYRDKV
jgi:hypothetical protein